MIDLDEARHFVDAARVIVRIRQTRGPLVSQAWRVVGRCRAGER
jgi:hypothetical protein